MLKGGDVTRFREACISRHALTSGFPKTARPVSLRL